MKNMLLKLNEIKDSQLRAGGLIFLVIGFLIVWLLIKLRNLFIEF